MIYNFTFFSKTKPLMGWENYLFKFVNFLCANFESLLSILGENSLLNLK